MSKGDAEIKNSEDLQDMVNKRGYDSMIPLDASWPLPQWRLRKKEDRKFTANGESKGIMWP